MKRTIAIILLISLVSACISSGGGEGGEKPGQQGGSIKTTTTLQTSSGGGIVDKIIDITTAIASGQSYKCTYTYEGVQSESWIKGERYYSKTTSDGGVSNVMTDGVWAYIWSEGQNTGLKFKILESGGINEEETGGYVDIGEIEKDAMNVDCKPAVIPDSMLTLPSNVEFTDLGELMRQMQELVNKTGGKLPGEEIPDQCSFCDMIPTEDAKEECLKNCQTA